MIRCIWKQYSNARVFATTLREVNHANSQQLGAIMLEGDNWHVVEPREFMCWTASVAETDLWAACSTAFFEVGSLKMDPFRLGNGRQRRPS